MSRAPLTGQGKHQSALQLLFQGGKLQKIRKVEAEFEFESESESFVTFVALPNTVNAGINNPKKFDALRV